MKKTGFRIPPVALIIVGVLMILGSLIAHFIVSADGREQREFLAGALSVNARCEDKESYTTGDAANQVTHYSLTFSFTIGAKEYKTILTSDDPSYNSVNAMDEVLMYYHPDDPMDCRPAFTFPDHTADNAVIFIISLIGVIIAAVNAVILIRNLNSPQMQEAPEEIGILGDNTVDNGLSDSSIDYSKSTPSADNSMDSFVDPFATYSGYNEDQADEAAGTGFDPNAGYDSSFDDPQIQHGDVDLNNPFVSADMPDPFMNNN